jgi:hypothetical protein
VLTNNYIVFDNKHYLQIKGTAMGTPCAVTFACLYIGMIEYDLTYNMILQGRLYDFTLYRFIDDIFGLFPTKHMATDYVESFNNMRKGQIILTYNIDNTTVDFLDITIFKGKRFHKEAILDTKLHQKPFNTYLYLPPISFHSKAIFPGFITSEIQRYCISNNNQEDFLHCKELFHQRLLKRGYSKRFLLNIFKKTHNRSELLNIRNKEKTTQTKEITYTTPIFQTTYTPRQLTLPLKHILSYENYFKWDNLAYRLFNTRRKHPIICYKRANNISDLHLYEPTK